MEKKTNVPGVYKVEEGILINKDNAALEAYKKRKKKEQKMDTFYEEMVVLKNDMQEIKQLLKGLVK